MLEVARALWLESHPLPITLALTSGNLASHSDEAPKAVASGQTSDDAQLPGEGRLDNGRASGRGPAPRLPGLMSTQRRARNGLTMAETAIKAFIKAILERLEQAAGVAKAGRKTVV